MDALCYIHDILPTLCELVDISAPEAMDGKSLVPFINGDAGQIRDYTYHAYRQHQRAYRKGDYKLIEYVRAPDHHKDRGDFIAGSRVTQLFNIAKDPWETFNLADFPEYMDQVALMRKEMKEKSVKLGDRADGERAKIDFWDYYQ